MILRPEQFTGGTLSGIESNGKVWPFECFIALAEVDHATFATATGRNDASTRRVTEETQDSRVLYTAKCAAFKGNET